MLRSSSLCIYRRFEISVMSSNNVNMRNMRSSTHIASFDVAIGLSTSISDQSQEPVASVTAVTN